MSHGDAALPETGRLRLAACIVENSWSLRRAAERFRVAATTAARCHPAAYDGDYCAGRQRLPCRRALKPCSSY